MACAQYPPKNFSEQLNALLQRAAASCEPSPAPWERLAREFGEEIYAEALYRLSRLELPPSEARDTIHTVLLHQDGLCQALGRNVSLVTALCDYFIQVKPMLREPILVEVNLLRQKEEGASRDELTGLFNRRSFNQEIPREMERFRRFGQSFTLLMLDLDHFKRFNDDFGHSAGDQALRDFARILGDTARLYDRAVRYGGEEFAVILPQASREEAAGVAERIRQNLERHRVVFAGQELPGLTVSIGLACFPADALDMASLVERADQALYQAKRTRNCVRPYGDQQRSHTRFILSDPLPVSLLGPTSELSALARDISFGGLLCETRTPLELATSLDLVLADSVLGIRLPIRAQVSRILAAGDSFHLGLSFDLPGVEDQKTLMALLEGRTAPVRGCAPDQRPAAGT